MEHYSLSAGTISSISFDVPVLLTIRHLSVPIPYHETSSIVLLFCRYMIENESANVECAPSFQNWFGDYHWLGVDAV
jgi:hypothetical protein